jgi:hypothetical protein
MEVMEPTEHPTILKNTLQEKKKKKKELSDFAGREP